MCLGTLSSLPLVFTCEKPALHFGKCVFQSAAAVTLKGLGSSPSRPAHYLLLDPFRLLSSLYLHSASLSLNPMVVGFFEDESVAT
jgi:hypothetical protein